MPNQIPIPRYKKGDKVRETHVMRLKTTKVNYQVSKTPNIKPKKGVIVSEPYRDKPDKAGRRRFKYDVKWDGRPKPESMYQSRIFLEEEES
jgi:hypothetical protein